MMLAVSSVEEEDEGSVSENEDQKEPEAEGSQEGSDYEVNATAVEEMQDELQQLYAELDEIPEAEADEILQVHCDGVDLVATPDDMKRVAEVLMTIRDARKAIKKKGGSRRSAGNQSCGGQRGSSRPQSLSLMRGLKIAIAGRSTVS